MSRVICPNEYISTGVYISNDYDYVESRLKFKGIALTRHDESAIKYYEKLLIEFPDLLIIFTGKWQYFVLPEKAEVLMGSIVSSNKVFINTQ